MKHDYILLIVGESGSGKSTIANHMENEYGCKQVLSYTTRPIRADDETNPSHTFVTKEEFDRLENRVAYTKFNNYEYCATAEQIEDSDIYIIDPAGIDYFKEKYHGYKTPIVVYIKTVGDVRRDRMLARGDDMYDVIDRLSNDIAVFKGIRKTADIIFENDKPNYEWICKRLYEKYFERKRDKINGQK